MRYATLFPKCKTYSRVYFHMCAALNDVQLLWLWAQVWQWQICKTNQNKWNQTSALKSSYIKWCTTFYILCSHVHSLVSILLVSITVLTYFTLFITYRIMHELPWITIFWSLMKCLPMIFMSENHWQITSWVTKKSLFMVMNVLFYFSHTILCSEHKIPLKTIINLHFAIVAKNSLFWLRIVTSPQLICDVTWSSIVTSYLSVVLACANWCKGHLH